MKRITTCILACALPLVLAAPGAFANQQGLPQIAEISIAHAGTHAQSHKSSTTSGRHASRRKSPPTLHDKKPLSELHGSVAHARPAHRSASEIKWQHAEVLAARKAAVREVLERNARANRLYQNSQFSAPIIINAKACKRIGVHGESIYENC